MTVPGWQTGAADDITASGQPVQVRAASSLFANDGDAVELLAFATNGTLHNPTGVIIYTSPCGGSNTQSYSLDTVPGWIADEADAAAVRLTARNLPGNKQNPNTPRIYALSVPLACPGHAIISISLPVVSNGVIGVVSAMHILGIGIQASSFTDSTNTKNWIGTYAIRHNSDSDAFANTTFRIPAMISVGGTSARVHLSNALGKTPVTFTDVTVALQSSAGVAAASAEPARLTFGGATSVTVPAGGDVTSDPVSLTLAQQATVLVSMTGSGSIAHVPAHSHNRVTSYYTADGADHAQDIARGRQLVELRAVAGLSQVDLAEAMGVS